MVKGIDALGRLVIMSVVLMSAEASHAGELCGTWDAVVSGTAFGVGDNETCSAGNSIQFGPDVTIGSGASISGYAPRIILKPPVTIAEGAQFVASQSQLSYVWRVGDYGYCEGPDIGEIGYQSRDVWCETDPLANVVPDQLCDAGSRPVETQSCLITFFAESFDNQDDYVSYHPDPLNYAENSVIPENWYALRQSSRWDPVNGQPDNHETVEILASNADKAKGGSGKSMVIWREAASTSPSIWSSEGMLMKYFPDGHDELYVSFWVNFDPNWLKSPTPGTSSKIFRITSWLPEAGEITSYFSDGANGPIMLWDYQLNSYGVRNTWSFRGGPYGLHYYMDDIEDFPRSLLHGDASMNFVTNMVGQGVGGADPQIVDQVNGGYLIDDADGVIDHDQLYGYSGHWTKLAFYVRMNSAPGIADGVVRQWINDELVLHNANVIWVGPKPWAPLSDTLPMPKWNVVAFGGNSYFPVSDVSSGADSIFSLADRHEEWYAIDDIEIHLGIPDGIIY